MDGRSDHCSCDAIQAVAMFALKRIMFLTVIEPMIFALPMRCAINQSMKSCLLGAGQFVIVLAAFSN